MLKAVKAIIEPYGTIRTLEPLRVEVATRAIVTLLTPTPADVMIEAGADVQPDSQDIPKRRFPIPDLAGKVKIIGDIVSPIVNEEDWECLK
ncbi:MAG TPA: hypothetical protein IGS52_25270 [Oscillatoriaceae cyanobacterium M33_DOE_052]|uniref:Uncharacterized protein n=1 Tax=Planktothricoides sp. SpSt-374 TaxID=2282167 RepID=A0A7C3VQH0_9CYAN|nr:hypothetical protein [Oscillatoriaceae cyanobacterium M33_DOE_052]